MRLSPKSIFFGVLVLGLPFALAAGWVLGTPAAQPAPASAPAGSGVLGAAPSRAAAPESVTALEWSPRPVRTAAPTVSRTPRRTAVRATASRSASPGRVGPSRTPPPTSAKPSESPSAPSVSPSPSTDAGQAGLGAGELVPGF
ncbi:hypothetical protein [Krasilnikovia sp. M28-CT-15]|uniref:hypothetical protein n=1 Tax=Krasilnikovia sp. M28-CT-15 TaxID=3373540 RepID=UPI00399D281A